MEEIKREKFLPIGTVVILKEAEKKLMVTGFLPIDNEGEPVTYDYSGCVYPEGILSYDETLLFNHEQIDKIFFLGYEDEEEKEFKKELMNELDDLLDEYDEDEDEEDDDESETEELEKKESSEKKNVFDDLRE